MREIRKYLFFYKKNDQTIISVFIIYSGSFMPEWCKVPEEIIVSLFIVVPKGGLEPPSRSIRTSSVRVYQFHHLGMFTL